MTEQWAVWELPAGEHLRTISQILQAPPSAEERREAKRDKAAEDEDKASELAWSTGADARAFMRAVNGAPAYNPLALAAAEPFRDRDALSRRRAAIDILRKHGLEDVVTGGTSGCVIDPNMGVLEPEPDTAQRDGLDRRYELQRSARQAEWRTREVDRYRQQLDERWARR